MAQGCVSWSQVDDLKDKLARSLADMENLRDRTARASEQSRNFAIQVGESALVGAVSGTHAQPDSTYYKQDHPIVHDPMSVHGPLCFVITRRSTSVLITFFGLAPSLVL